MTQISPNFSHEKIESASTDDLIDVLEDRVVYWLLKPAKTLLETSHGNIPAVSLLLSYFEAHAIYLMGKDSLGQSKRFFREGFVDVFASPNHDRAFLQRVADFLYEQARCGFFHDGIFRDKVLFCDDLPGEFIVTVPQRNGKPDDSGTIVSVVINPGRFLNALVSHFANYISRLRDGAHMDARDNFRRSVEIKWSPSTPGPIIGMDEETFTKLSRQKANPWVEKSSRKRASEAFEDLRAKMTNTEPLTPDEEEILRSPEKLRDLLEIPNDAMEVLGAYSAVLAEGRRLLKPLSALPYPKTRIEEALQVAMHNARDPGTLRNLEIALDGLKDFIPDSEVPTDPEENAKAWFAHRAGQRP